MQAVGTTDPATLLLAETVRISQQDRVLVLSASDPALALFAARQAASVDVYDISYTSIWRAWEYAKVRLGDNAITFNDVVFPAADSGFDIALMTVPKGRDFARAQLLSALKALRPGGRLYIAGPTQGGAKSVLEDAAALFGRSVTLSTKRRYRVGVAVRPDNLPEYPVDWEADPTINQQRTFETPKGSFIVATMPGLFSWQHLDEGTAFLLENLGWEPAKSVLDVGCGNGIVGIVAAQSASRVVMIDDNLLAVHCAQASIEINKLTNAIAQPGDVYNGLDSQQFDLIVSNPPFHKDFDVNTNVAHRIMREAKTRLNPGGRLVIVANAFLNYEVVMEKQLPRSRVLARNNHFIVIEGRR